MIDKLLLYLQIPFVRYALVVGVLVALCSSLLGVTLVLKRFSYIGDGLSHVAFGTMAIASALRVAAQNTVIESALSATGDMILVMPLTILCAVLLLKTGRNTAVKGDAAIAMLSVGALSFGYLIMNIFPTSGNLSGDVCSTLFGSTSILTLRPADLIVCVILSVIVILVFVFLYNKVFAVTFDEDFAKAIGTRAELYNLIIAIVTAVIIVLAMDLVGTLLISALVIFPAISAMRLFKSYKAVTVCSVILSVFCAAAGMIISILAGTPVGSTIVAVDVAAFAICWLIGKFRG
ncbi:MAG: metal ABC transporter permease [Lachnospiraceae bacterium]|nr:metal ABC transporter permease [Lachnospiraceae bacterium]